MANKKYVSLSKLSTFLDNLKDTFSALSHKHTLSDITDYTVDSALSSTSTNPVQNKVLDAEFEAISEAMNALDSAIDGKSDSGHNHNDVYYQKTEIDTKLASKSDSTHNHDNLYDTKGAAAESLASANSYTDTKVANLASTSTVDTKISTHNTSTSAHNDIRDLITGLTTRLNTLANSDDTTLDQMSEVVDYIKNNKSLIDGITTSKVNVSDIVNNLTTNVTNKPLSAAQGVAIKSLIDALQEELDSHTHAIADVSGLQSALDGKAASDHGIHVTYSTTAPVMDGTASVGTASTVARSDHKHPTDTSRASKTEFDTHVSDTTKHITSTERTNWNTAATNVVTAQTRADEAYTLANNAMPKSGGTFTGSVTIGSGKVLDFVTMGGKFRILGGGSTDTASIRLVDNGNNVIEDILQVNVNTGEVVGGVLMEKNNPTGTGTLSLNRKADTTIGQYSTATGYNTEASGIYSHAEGDRTTSSGSASHAEGLSCTASNQGAHAEGLSCTASGKYSHAEGQATTASESAAHAEGINTLASGMYCHAEGSGTVAKGYQTHAEGSGTIAAGSNQHVQGTYNVETPYRYAHIVGNGSSDTDRSNAHTLDWSGNAWFAGDVYVGGTSQDNGSPLVSQADLNWNLIYDSGEITSSVNAFANINISGYKKLRVVAKCVNDGTNSTSKNGAVTFTATNGTTYQFPCWTTMFTNAAYTSGCMATFEVNDGWLVCPNASRILKTSNFLGTEGGTVDNLPATGGGIMKCTNELSTMMVSALDQDTNYYFLAGSRVMVWGCKI